MYRVTQGVTLCSVIESPFSTLPADAARALVDAARLHTLTTDDVVFAEGDAGTGLCLVASGLLAVQVRGAGGPSTVNVLGPGDMVGETAVFARAARRTATVVARAPSRLLELDLDSFAALRAAHPVVGDLFLRILAERSAALSARMAEGQLPAKERVARRLLDLPRTDPDAALLVTQADLAGLSGVSLAELADALSALAALGAIASPEEPRVIDRPALTAAASLP